MALIAAHLGIVDEDDILNMSYDWFSEVLDVLGEVVNYNAVVNYAGNAFVEKSWDMIMDANPMLKGVIMTSQERQMAAFFNNPDTIIIRHNENKGDMANGNG